jgi:3-mercaptopyruvate sulfurtransferase SseA
MKSIAISLVLFLSVMCSGSTHSLAGAKDPQAGDGARRITPAELRDLIKKGEAILIDVRSEEAYKAGHIKGARLIPASEIGNRVDELPRNKLIATYCS